MNIYRINERVNSWTAYDLADEFKLTPQEYRKHPIMTSQVNPQNKSQLQIRLLTGPAGGAIILLDDAAKMDTWVQVQSAIISNVLETGTDLIKSLPEYCREQGKTDSASLQEQTAGILFRILHGLLKHFSPSGFNLMVPIAFTTPVKALGASEPFAAAAKQLGIPGDGIFTSKEMMPFDMDVQHLLWVMMPLAAQIDNGQSGLVMKTSGKLNDFNMAKVGEALVQNLLTLQFDPMVYRIIIYILFKLIADSQNLTAGFNKFMAHLDQMAPVAEDEDVHAVFEIALNLFTLLDVNITKQMILEMDVEKLNQQFGKD